MILNTHVVKSCLNSFPSTADITYYTSSSTIKCRDNSKVLEADRINDDFCDCLDGSDEPGRMLKLCTLRVRTLCMCCLRSCTTLIEAHKNKL